MSYSSEKVIGSQKWLALGKDGVSNIWSRAVEGGAPKQLTKFPADQIFSFDWSRDGKTLACSRGVATTDVVLIKDNQREKE